MKCSNLHKTVVISNLINGTHLLSLCKYKTKMMKMYFVIVNHTKLGHCERKIVRLLETAIFVIIVRPSAEITTYSNCFALNTNGCMLSCSLNVVSRLKK